MATSKPVLKPKPLPMPGVQDLQRAYAARPEPEVTMPADSTGREQVGKEIQSPDGSSGFFRKPAPQPTAAVDKGFNSSSPAEKLKPKGTQNNHAVTTVDRKTGKAK
jgi:hypothetical protein